MIEKNEYDVIITGGGLAGLTLALQLSQNNASISILVIEKRDKRAPVATHKVGESTSEMGAYYLRNKLGLGEYLDHSHLRKFGFRFFFSPELANDISKRVEVGSRIEIPHPAYQIDRGIFENEILEQIDHQKVTLIKGAGVNDIEFNAKGHLVTYQKDGEIKTVKGRWYVDATGRRGVLRRKLELDMPVDHKINSAWFRIAEPMDIDDWSDDVDWKMHFGMGKRRFSTNHLMGKGYWFWIIPLVSSSTSFGIVADPRYHPFETFNTFEKAMEWLKLHEPHAARMIEGQEGKLLDFKVMKDFSYNTRQYYSSDRWALTGEAAAFLDPFYSPGTDFIALSNTWITDLITRDLRGENILMRTKIYELAHRELFNGWLTLYKDKYKLFNNTQVMLAKITWDWSTYWGIPALLFMNNGYTDLNVLKNYSSSEQSIGSRFGNLNQRIQQFFVEWDALSNETCRYERINTFSLKILYDFHMGLYQKYEKDQLIAKISANLDRIEDLYRAIFSKVANQIKGVPSDLPIDPYTMSLSDESDVLIAKSQSSNAKIPDRSSVNDIELIWLIDPEKMESTQLNSPASNIESVEKKFMHSMHTAECSIELSELVEHLESDSSAYRSIAFEGASFSIGAKELQSGNQLKKWAEFRNMSDPAHVFHIDIGLGWSYAKWGKYPTQEEHDPLTLTLLFDGMGYYYALFKARKTIIDHEYPAGLPAMYEGCFDRGIGRRIWYMAKGNFEELAKLVDSFEQDRQHNLWHGIGVASIYVGGLTAERLNALISISGMNQEAFKKGASLAFLSRQKSIDRTHEMDIYARQLFNLSAQKIIELLRGNLNSIIPDEIKGEKNPIVPQEPMK